MSEQSEAPKNEEVSQPSAAVPENTGTDDKSERESMIPRARFDEVYEQLKELKKWREGQEKADAKRQEQERLQRGEHEEVIAELKPKAERAERLEGVLVSMLEVEIEQIPDKFKSLIPDGDVAAKLDWIAKAKSAGVFTPAKPTPPDINATEGSTAQNAGYSEDVLNWANMLGISPEAYIKRQQEIKNERS